MKSKEEKRIRRHRGIRKRIIGTTERPRLAVHRSLKNLYIQVVDDQAEMTLLSYSTMKLNGASGTKTEVSSACGKEFADKLTKKGIKKIAFDRAGYKYHGRIKAFAEALRESGIEF